MQQCFPLTLALIVIFTDNIYIFLRILPVNEFKPVFSSPSYVFNASEIIAGK